MLRHESRRVKVPLKLPTIGLVDVVAQGIMPLMATLETESQRLQNKSSDLWLRTCPKIVLPSASITDIVSAPLSRLTHTLAPVPAEMAFRIENLFKYRQEEAGKRHGAAHVHGHLESATMPISASNERWHKKLWELLVVKAVQEPDSLSRLSRLHNAHIKVQLMFPQVTVADFSHTLKTYSVRTPEEQSIIIRDLAQRCPAQRLVRGAIPPLPHKSIGAGHSQTPHYVLLAAQTPPHAHDSTGNTDGIGGNGFSDLIIPTLATAISALEMETLRLSCSILRHESRRVKVSLKLPTIGLVDVVVQGIMPLMATLETEALRLQNKSSDLWLRTYPKIVLPSANITDIVSAPLSRLTRTLAPVSAEMAFRIENIYKYSQEEGKRYGAAHVRGHLESTTMPISACNEIWHKKLWELLVVKAEQEPSSLDRLSRLHNAHINVQSMFPQVTVADFSRTLKTFSVRTPEEQGIIIRDLAQRCPAQRPVRVKIPPLPHNISVQQKTALQAPPTDTIQAMRKLWNEIQTFAEKDGKIYLNTADGKIKLKNAIEHIWRNNSEISFEFMQKTIFRRVVSDRDNFERFLQQTYASIATLKDLHDGSDIQQSAVLACAPHSQSSQGSKDNDGDDSGNSMSFT